MRYMQCPGTGWEHKTVSYGPHIISSPWKRDKAPAISITRGPPPLLRSLQVPPCHVTDCMIAVPFIQIQWLDNALT